VRRHSYNTLLAGIDHPIIGYIGAIADWFDVDLVADAATQRPDWQFVLVGGVFGADTSVLRSLPNVHLLGQKPYATMPAYLYNFDVCIIPFKVNEITHATDPVKLYEYFSSGKPVVATDMREIRQYSSLVYLANNSSEFISKIESALAEEDVQLRMKRVETARVETWSSRYESVDHAIRALFKHVSIVVVTYNNLVYTRLCLESIIQNTDYPNYEIVVVDNGSHDGTSDYLRFIEKQHSFIRVILNSENEGFARANNQGLQVAVGDVLVLLNNDTIVPRGWLQGLTWHLQDTSVGLVGPVTNFVGNEARVDATYSTYEEFVQQTTQYCVDHERRVFDIRMLAMFCLAMRKDVFELLGPLDERFGIGMFEDDDYAIRARAAGFRVVCAEDVFVHHFGQASFGKLIETGEYQEIWDRNQKLFEAKWHRAWDAHRTR
jgi:GT2 family glycosyltransferase